MANAIVKVEQSRLRVGANKKQRELDKDVRFLERMYRHETAHDRHQLSKLLKKSVEDNRGGIHSRALEARRDLLRRYAEAFERQLAALRVGHTVGHLFEYLI